MVLAPKTVRTLMAPAVYAWMLWITSIKGFEMAVQHIKPRELFTALASVRLVLLLSDMVEEGSFGWKRRFTFEAAIRRVSLGASVPSSMWPSGISIALIITDKRLVAINCCASKRRIGSYRSVVFKLLAVV